MQHLLQLAHCPPEDLPEIIVIDCTVIGKPRPQGSKRYLGGNRIVESNPNTHTWRSDVRSAIASCIPHDWDRSLPMSVHITFGVHRPKAHYLRSGLRPSAPLYPITRSVGDIEKLIRAINDSITGIAFDDDSQVVRLTSEKIYIEIDEPEHARIRITPA